MMRPEPSRKAPRAYVSPYSFGDGDFAAAGAKMFEVLRAPFAFLPPVLANMQILCI